VRLRHDLRGLRRRAAGRVRAAPLAGERVAQLRWFLVDASARGRGLGRRLLDAAVAFSREAGYERVMLWTVAGLDAALHLYRAAGFERIMAAPASRWGVEVVEEQHALVL
jgi:GNAT superfamily N-acetyltransferase